MKSRASILLTLSILSILILINVSEAQFQVTPYSLVFINIEPKDSATVYYTAVSMPMSDWPTGGFPIKGYFTLTVRQGWFLYLNVKPHGCYEVQEIRVSPNDTVIAKYPDKVLIYLSADYINVEVKNTGLPEDQCPYIPVWGDIRVRKTDLMTTFIASLSLIALTFIVYGIRLRREKKRRIEEIRRELYNRRVESIRSKFSSCDYIGYMINILLFDTDLDEYSYEQLKDALTNRELLDNYAESMKYAISSDPPPHDLKPVVEWLKWLNYATSFKVGLKIYFSVLKILPSSSKVIRDWIDDDGRPMPYISYSADKREDVRNILLFFAERVRGEWLEEHNKYMRRVVELYKRDPEFRRAIHKPHPYYATIIYCVLKYAGFNPEDIERMELEVIQPEDKAKEKARIAEIILRQAKEAREKLGIPSREEIERRIREREMQRKEQIQTVEPQRRIEEQTKRFQVEYVEGEAWRCLKCNTDTRKTMEGWICDKCGIIYKLKKKEPAETWSIKIPPEPFKEPGVVIAVLENYKHPIPFKPIVEIEGYEVEVYEEPKGRGRVPEEEIVEYIMKTVEYDNKIGKIPVLVFTRIGKFPPGTNKCFLERIVEVARIVNISSKTGKPWRVLLLVPRKTVFEELYEELCKKLAELNVDFKEVTASIDEGKILEVAGRFCNYLKEAGYNVKPEQLTEVVKVFPNILEDFKKLKNVKDTVKTGLGLENEHLYFIADVLEQFLKTGRKLSQEEIEEVVKGSRALVWARIKILEELGLVK